MRFSVLLLCILIAPGVCASRMLAQQAVSPVPAVEPISPEVELQPLGADGPAPASAQPSSKIIVTTPDQLMDSVRQGHQHIEVAAHLNMSTTAGLSQDFPIIPSGDIFLRGACKEDLETPTIDIPLKFRQCVITLGGEAKGFLAALGAEVVLSDIVFSRRPSGASEPTITATDSSLFMERVAIIVDKDSDGTAQALRLRSSRALLSDVHLQRNKGRRGGAIDAIASSLAITEGSFLEENKATETSGGAIWMAYSMLRMSSSTCLNNTAAQGGGAIALQSPTDVEIRGASVISRNYAAVLGGAILLEGSLGNNSLGLYGSYLFEGNTANNIGQDIVVLSAGTVTFDSESSVSKVIGEGAEGFAWQPTVFSSSTSSVDEYPSLLDRTESWIDEAKQVLESEGTDFSSSSFEEEQPNVFVSVEAPPEPCTSDRSDSNVVIILAAISGTLLLCTLSLAAAVCILRQAIPTEPLLSARSTATKTSSVGRGTPRGQHRSHTHSGTFNERPHSGGGSSHVAPHGQTASRMRAAAMRPHSGDAASPQQPRGAIDAGPDSAADRASWYGERKTGAAAALVPPLRIGGANSKKGMRSHPWRRMFGREESVCDSPELNTINEEEEPHSAGIVNMHSPGSGRCAVIMVPSTVSSGSSSSSSDFDAGAEFKTTVTVQREGGTKVFCQSPDSSSIGSSSMDSISSTLTHDDTSDQSASPVVRAKHRVQRVLMTDVSPLNNEMNSLDSFPGLQRALMSEPASTCKHRQGAAGDMRIRRGHDLHSNSSVRSHDSNVSGGSKQGPRSGPNSGPWSGERVHHPPPRPQSHRPWVGEKSHQPRPTSAPVDVDFGMSVIDGLEHRVHTLNSGPLGGPTSGSGVLDDQAHIVDSIMRSDVGRSAAIDGLDATSTHCSNTFFLLPPRSISPQTYGAHQPQPHSRDLEGLTDDLFKVQSHKSTYSETDRGSLKLKRMSQELKARSHGGVEDGGQ